MYHPSRGTPLVYSGNFAAVYPVSNGNRKYAVRCFTRAVNDQQSRYGHLSDYLRYTLPPTLVEFEYVERGIRVRGDWYPIVKMEWVNGDPLNRYVRENLGVPTELNRIARRWRGAVGDLISREIAHNDLQHGNVMVQDDTTIRLVDYDGIFLPEYRGQKSPEIGHQNYQHSQRTGDDYDGYVDNFPALVIYLSLLALVEDPDLWHRFNNDDNLILKKSDYADPANSECFRALRSNPSDTVQQLSVILEECCARPVERVPDLESILSDIPAPSVSAAPSVTSAPSFASAPATPVTPTPNSDYRRLIQQGQQPPNPAASVAAQRPATAPVAAVPSLPPSVATVQTVSCPQCRRANPASLIFCDDERCFAELQPGRRFCNHCGGGIPIKAVFCHGCGRQLS